MTCGRCSVTLMALAIRCGRRLPMRSAPTTGNHDFGKFDPAQQQTYSAGVEAVTAPVATALATKYDFNRHRRLLDVAGGTGSFLLAVLRQHPSLRGTLFELPGACAVAQQRLSTEPEKTRIDFVEGDVFKSSLPANHDVVLVANLVHMFTPTNNVELLRRIRAVVQMDTRLLLVDFWPDPRYTEAAALMSGEFLLVSGDGKTYSEGREVALAYQMAQARAQAVVRAD